MRIPIAAIGVFLAAIDFAAGGPRLAVSYFTSVLPNHAASEIGFITQYSVTWLAQALGAPDRLALVAGSVSYVVMIVCGIWLAGILARRFADQAFLFVIPAALAVTGGSFIHYSEITLAIPAALLLYSSISGQAKKLVGAAVILIAVPWQSIMTKPILIFALTVAAIAIAAFALRASTRDTLRIGCVAAVVCAICIVLAWRYGPQTSPHVITTTFIPALAESSWARYIYAQSSSSHIVWLIPKLPTWIGLALLALGGAFARSHKDDVTGVAIEYAPAGS